MSTIHPLPIGILGGTFDPIHVGHLRCAIDLLENIPFQQIRFIPCKQPVHKNDAKASQNDRWAMIQMALQDQPNLIADPREIMRHSPSYMIETLESLRQEFPITPLCLILGEDAFWQLDTWKKWPSLFDLTHFIVIPRPEPIEPSPTIETFVSPRKIGDQKSFQQTLSGFVYYYRLPYFPVSSSLIRSHIAQNKRIDFLVPDRVKQYIQEKKLYSISI